MFTLLLGTRDRCVMVMLACLGWCGLWHTLGHAAEVEIEGRKFVIPPGFQLRKVAGSPLVERPITAALDEAGRLYLTDSSGSNEPVEVQLEKRPHRIVCLTDSNRDGTYDQQTVYVDRLMFPEGSLWHAGSLYVSAPPHIWKFTDTTGDGVADSREIWFDGKTLTDCANDLHGPYLGRDGWIYWCKGGFADQQIDLRDGSVLASSAAHIFRRHPSGGGVEIVMTGGMDNPVDVVSLPTGERFFTCTFAHHPRDGFRDGVLHAVHGSLFGKEDDCILGHPRTGELLPVMTELGPAAPCGLELLEHPAWGADANLSLVVAQFNLRKVSQHKLTETGSSFTTQDANLVVTEDVDFHPTDVIEDADGSLLIVDTGGWYDLCCPTSHLWKPDIRGAVYRLEKDPQSKTKDPRGLEQDWQQRTPQEWVRQLDDPRPAVRRRSIEALRALDSAAFPFLTVLLKDPQSSELARQNALWIVAGVSTLPPEADSVLLLGMQDQAAAVRCVAWQVASLHPSLAWGQPVVSSLKSADTLNPQERRLLLEVAGRLAAPLAIAAAAPNSDGQQQLLEQAILEFPDALVTDRMLEHAAVYALLECAKQHPEPFLSALRQPLSDGQTRRLILALSNLPGEDRLAKWIVAADWESFSLATQQAIAQTLSQHVDDSAELVLPRIRAHWEQPGSHPLPEHLAALIAAYAKSSQVQSLAAELLTRTDEAGQAMRLPILRSLLSAGLDQLPEGFSAGLSTCLTDERTEVIAATAELLRTAPLPSVAQETLRTRLTQLVHDQQRAIAIRAKALAALPAEHASCPDNLLQPLLTAAVSAEDRQQRAEATTALANVQLTRLQQQWLLGQLSSAGPIEFASLLAILERSPEPELATELLAMLQQAPSAATIPIGRLSALLTAYGPRAVEEGRPLLAKLAPSLGEQQARIEELLATLPAGDVRRGFQVFRGSKAACATCHRLGYVGGAIGPDLGRVGDIRTKRDLLESIVFPSASFVRSFEPTQITTVQGEVFNGLVKSRSGGEVLLTIAADKEVKIPVDQIDSEVPGSVSVMPSGLDRQLSLEELADLLAFLQSAK